MTANDCARRFDAATFWLTVSTGVARNRTATGTCGQRADRRSNDCGRAALSVCAHGSRFGTRRESLGRTSSRPVINQM